MDLKKQHMQRQGGAILHVKIRSNNLLNVKNKVLGHPPYLITHPSLSLHLFM